MTGVVPFTLWALIVVYAAARFLQSFGQPTLAVVALHVLPPAIFALIHGSALYRWRGVLVFAALSLTIGNLVENLGILTGFPFGRYHFTDVMGPKILNVPIFLGLAYVGMGYLSWILACLIVSGDAAFAGRRVWTLPLAASFIMVAWDISMDPVWSTVVHAWIWHDGGPFFGVPVSNFLGWYLTNYLIFQSFALYVRRRPQLPTRYWRQAAVFYAVSAAGNLLLVAPPGISVVTDATGATWRIRDIIAMSAVTSIFTMGAFAALAWARVWTKSAELQTAEKRKAAL